MKIHLVTAALLAASGAATAACDLQEYSLTGTAATRDGAPVPGAVVEATWDEKLSGGASTRTKSGADGRFTLTIQFDPYSGRSIGGDDRCDAKLGDVRVKARAGDGLEARERRVELAEATELAIELR